MNNINDKIKSIYLENIVIYIYFIILLIYLYANRIEVNYIYHQNEKDKEKYRNLLCIVFAISLIISTLFTIDNIKELYKYEKNEETYKLKELSAFASILIVIATTIYLYIIYEDKDIKLEISP